MLIRIKQPERGTMKRLLVICAGLFLSSSVFAQTYVKGYTRSNGTYVAPHYRSSPNSTTVDNYSTKGNVNPYTGSQGTKTPTYGTSSSGTTYKPYKPYGK
jgi:hypothetical protein